MTARHDEHAAPRFIRLLARFPGACMLLWIAVPAILGALVAPSLQLSEPETGWRMREDKTAEALNALISGNILAHLLHDES